MMLFCLGRQTSIIYLKEHGGFQNETVNKLLIIRNSTFDQYKTAISVRTNKSNISKLDAVTAARAGNLRGSFFPSTKVT
jgi:hypothetical protein